jgi:hypothetical protein
MNTDNVVSFVKGSAIAIAIGFGMWKLGKSNLVKAMGAGVLGVTAVGAVQAATVKKS